MATIIAAGRTTTLAIVLLCILGLLFSRGGAAEKPAAEAARKESKPATGRLFIELDGRHYWVDPDNGDMERIAPTRGDGINLAETPFGGRMSVQPSPDSRQIALWLEVGKRDGESILDFCEESFRRTGRRVQLPGSGGYRRFCWSPDGKQILVSQSRTGAQGGVEHHLVNAMEASSKELTVLSEYIVVEWHRSGRLLSTRVGADHPWKPSGIHVMNIDGTEHRQVTKAEKWCAALSLSPDGARTLCIVDGALVVVDATGFAKRVEGAPAVAAIVGAAWSPGGDRIAYCTDARLVVCDPDGRKTMIVRSPKGESYSALYWR